eukprot:359279-Hanusia_phi.AAC.3
MGINGSLMYPMAVRSMRSGRLESREIERQSNKRSTRESSKAVNRLKTVEEEMMDTESKMSINLKTDWYSPKKQYVCPVTLECVDDECMEECPILMEKFQECKLECKPDLQYKVVDKNGNVQTYNKVTIDKCNHSFFPLALAMHWMVHNMKCPLCKYGEEKKLSSTCLPMKCANSLRVQVRKIKNEMDEEMFESDLRLVENMRFNDDMEIIGSLSGERFPTSIMLDVIPLQNWEIIVDHMKLNVVFHYDINTITQDRVLSILDSLGVGSQWRLERSSEDTEMFRVQGSLSLCEDTMITDDPSFGFMNVPRSQCRLISRINQMTKPCNASYSLIYEDYSLILTVCKVEYMELRCGSRDNLFASTTLIMSENEESASRRNGCQKRSAPLSASGMISTSRESWSIKKPSFAE